MAGPGFSYLDARDLQQHSDELRSLGYRLDQPTHYRLLRRFVRSFTDEGTVNRKTLTDVANNRERFHRKGGGTSPK